MFVYSQKCTICLKSDNENPKLIDESDSNNIPYILKLKFIIPEIEWNPTHIICTFCIKQLDAAHNFKVIALNSHKSFKTDNFDQPSANRAEKLKLETDNISDNDCDNNLGHDDKKPYDRDVFICHNCNKDFSTKNHLLSHWKKKHLKQTNELSGPICDKNHLKKHKVEHKFKFSCPDCDETFINSTKFIRHCVNIHNREESKIRPFYCSECGRSFDLYIKLQKHRKYHLRNHICTYCGKSFMSNSDLKCHENTHLNKREYHCDICPKNFNTNQNLLTHKLVKHVDPSKWQHQCNLCNKKFPMRSNYNIHMKRHMGIKTFTCPMCEKTFISRDEQERHSMTHSNIRAFHCDVCRKEYRKKRTLLLHLKKVHDIGSINLPVRVRKHICEICAKAFYDKSKLTRHSLTHKNKAQHDSLEKSETTPIPG